MSTVDENFSKSGNQELCTVINPVSIRKMSGNGIGIEAGGEGMVFNVSFLPLLGSDGATIEGGLDWSSIALYWEDALPYLKPMAQAGFEPGTSRSEGQRSNHCTTSVV